jgi:capsular exopolysaccharide synthesis family protein
MDSLKVITETNPHSPVADAFQIFRINLERAIEENNLKSLLITSVDFTEGKSIIAANLAIVMAQTGVKVILLDCNLRNPKQHILFDLPNYLGLTSILAREREVETVLNCTAISNLNIITSGVLPSNPASLLSMEELGLLFKELSGMADIVIVDSAPVLQAADPIIISSKLDGVVLVVETGKTKNDAVVEVKEILERAKAKLIGIVMYSMQKLDSTYSQGEIYHNNTKLIAATNRQGD